MSDAFVWSDDSSTGTSIGQKLKVIVIYRETLSKEVPLVRNWDRNVLCDFRKKSWSEVSIEEAGWWRGGEGGSSM